MEYATEIVNISKIEDGFFIGDRYCATNLDVIIQFKITHIINTSGNQILNQFETIGVKYFNLHYQEIPTQILFDSKDEISNKIVSFINDSFINGEGLLVHSVKGINRALVVVIIYFMKKYWWSVKKCMEFINIKVKNGKIAKYFIKQLETYEKRIKRNMSKEWYNINSIKTAEEMIIRNTYLNSLLKTQKRNLQYKIDNINNPQYKMKYNDKNHVKWGNINEENKNDLFLQKNIKEVDSHIRLRPNKKCYKDSKNIKEDTENEAIISYVNNNLKEYMSNNIVNENIDINEKNNMKNLINLGLNMKIVDKINKINDNFKNLNMPKQRPGSAEQKMKNIDNNVNAKINNKANNRKSYDFDKLSNYFDKLERKEKEKMAQNKNYKKLILKQANPHNKINKIYNSDNPRKRNSASYDTKNNKNGVIKINRQYIYPDKIINNSININMINYITNNSSQQIPPFNKNNFINNESFSIGCGNYDPYNFFSGEGGDDNAMSQQNFNSIKNKMNQRNGGIKMNNSANNFYNYNTIKNKDGINNNYYNVMGQSFNMNSIQNKSNNKKVSIFLKGNKSKTPNMNNNPYIYKVSNSKNTNNFIQSNNKNMKRTSTPNNLLPKRNCYLNSYNEEKNSNNNYISYSNFIMDDSNINNNKIDNSFNSRSYVLNQKNLRNQCKCIFILKYIF